MKRLLKYLSVIIVSVITSLLVNKCSNSKHPVGCEWNENDYTLTVDDVIRYRKDIIEAQYVDSVFLQMPEPVLREILEKWGTDLSNHEIVNIYENDREYYSKILDEEKE